MVAIQLLLAKNTSSAEELTPLVFRIEHRVQTNTIDTGYKLAVNQFNPVSGCVIFSRHATLTPMTVRKMNQQIRRQRANILNVIHQLENQTAEYTVNQIVQQYQALHTKGDFWICLEQKIDQKLALGCLGTAEAYRNAGASLQRFWGSRDIGLSDLTPQFIQRYEQYLHQTGAQSNTIAYYLRNLRTIFNYAVEQQGKLGEASPFRHISTRPAKTIKRAIGREKLRRMQELDLSDTPGLSLARDIFLFSFYTRGMSLVDIVFLTQKNLERGVLTYSRRKTHQLISILLTESAKQLLERYRNDSEYLFPLITSSKPEIAYRQYRSFLRRVNLNLKTLARKLDLGMPLSTYVARHSWATQAKECGAPISVISEGLGHTSERTTQIYLKQFDRSVLDNINEIVTNLSQS